MNQCDLTIRPADDYPELKDNPFTHIIDIELLPLDAAGFQYIDDVEYYLTLHLGSPPKHHERYYKTIPRWIGDFKLNTSSSSNIWYWAFKAEDIELIRELLVLFKLSNN